MTSTTAKNIGQETPAVTRPSSVICSQFPHVCIYLSQPSTLHAALLVLDIPVRMLTNPLLDLQPRIDLGVGVSRPVCPPGIAVVVVLVLVRLAETVAQVIGALEILHRQTARHVPGNVAVEKPSTGVVRLEGDEQPSVGGKHGDVATDRVGALEQGHVSGGIEAVACLRNAGLLVGGAADDEEIMTVKMHRVRNAEGAGRVVLDEPVSPLVDAVDGDDVGLRRIAGVLGNDVVNNRFVPVDINGAAIDLPDKEGCAADGQGDGQSVVRAGSEATSRNAAGDNRCQVVQVHAVSISSRSANVGRESVRSSLVAEDRSRVRIERSTAGKTAAKGGVEPVVPNTLVGVNSDIVALANGKEETVDSLGLNGNHVGGNDGHGVILELQLEVIVGRGVDDAETMTLAGGERDIGKFTSAGLGILSVPFEENSVTGRGTAIHGFLNQDISWLVVVVGDGEDTKIDIVGKRSRTIDHDGANDAVAILGREMRVVPTGAILLSAEPVDAAASLGRDRAFGDTVGTIVHVRSFLVETVPMNRGAARKGSVQVPWAVNNNNVRNIPISPEIVDDIDLNPITPVSSNGRP